MSLSSVLKQRRKELGLTLLEIAEKMGVSEATAQRWESGGIKTLRQGRIAQLAEILNVSPAKLMGWEDNDSKPPIPSNAIPYEPPKHIAPILGCVRAGVGGLAVQEITGYDELPECYVDDGEDYFWLTVEGDSMEPKLEPGDRVLVRSQPSVDSGDVAVVIIDGEEGVVKKVRYGPDWIELISFNRYYPPRRFEGEDVLKINVVGRVMQSKHTW